MPTYRKVGNLLFLSGVGPRYMEKDSRLSTDFAEQCAEVFEAVDEILVEADASWEDLVDITVFLTDMAADLTTFEEIWAGAFPDPATEPCLTIVQADAIPSAGALYIKCVAATPESNR